MKISVCLLVVITTTLDRVTWSADLVVVWPYRIHVIQLLEILCWKILTVIFGQKTVKNYIFVITPCRLKISIAHFRPKITLFVFMDDKDQNQGWSGFGQNVILWRILSSHMIYKSKVFHPNSSNFAMFLGLWVENSYVMVRSYVRVLKIVGLKIFDKTYFASRMRFACWSLRVFFSSLSFNITLFNGVGFFCLGVSRIFPFFLGFLSIWALVADVKCVTWSRLSSFFCSSCISAYSKSAFCWARKAFFPFRRFWRVSQSVRIEAFWTFCKKYSTKIGIGVVKVR